MDSTTAATEMASPNVSSEVLLPSPPPPDCPQYSDADFQMLDEVSFWMEGVVQVYIYAR